MKMNLCVDWGNTRLKAALVNPADGRVADSWEGDDAAGVEHFLAHKSIRAAILASVVDGALAEPLAASLRAAGIKTLVLDGRTPLPIANAYGSPDTVGADRLALATGAWALAPNEDALVVSAGTCITYNFITRTRTFRGGAISPGLAMRLEAMHRFTDGLPLVPLEGDTRLLGYDTESALRSGAVIGAAAEVEGCIALYREQYPALQVFITGGNASLIARHLRSAPTHEPHLAFAGLNAILQYNVPSVAA